MGLQIVFYAWLIPAVLGTISIALLMPLFGASARDWWLNSIITVISYAIVAVIWVYG